MANNKFRNYTPLIIAVSVAVGILVGSFYASHFRSNRLSIANSTNSKINDMLFAVEDRYVDTVDINDLVEKSLPKILLELDPHSTYTSAKEVEAEMQELKGEFSGIGVIFSIIKDTARIVHVVEGGPSEDVGLMDGDRIVKVDGKPFVGDFLTDEYAMKKLRGPNNSVIKLGIMRRGTPSVRTFEVTRGPVPVKTIDVYSMIDKTTGYIRINTFGERTYEELLVALAELRSQGANSLVIDLRGNGGGYMDAAINIANQFLPGKRMIVYTEGRKSERTEYRSDGRGDYKTTPLVVLVDETSASASEIFAAAIQDNDRGIIMGRRTFGKGLVQEPIQFPDGSLLKLTIARYYSPSGRCLQKPYVKGDAKDYQNDIFERYQKGELLSEDSIHLSGKKYSTHLGRTVFGGGGVMPDIFIPADTTDITSYYMEAASSRRLAEFAFNYADSHRDELRKYRTWEELAAYLKKQNLVDKFATYAERDGLKRRNLLIRKSQKLLEDNLLSSIIDYLLDAKSASLYLLKHDTCITKALELIRNKQTQPQPPEKKEKELAKQKNSLSPHIYIKKNSYLCAAKHKTQINT
ncbi:MAG: S41 family peptidase [Bacteroidaceae bacterium]|nr:S41 family peptidase [Bacteroidaceae bacterium]